MSTHPIPDWDARDLRELLALDEVGPGAFRTRASDANAHGRVYGGQVLAVALAAAARTVSPGRRATAMQFTFLQGTLHGEAVDVQVTALQDGKRFSSRHARGVQAGGRCVFDAQVTFALDFDAPEHGAGPPVPLEDPETLPPIDQLPTAWGDAVEGALGFRMMPKAGVDFRLAGAPELLRLSLPEPRLRFWVRLAQPLGDDPHLHAAAFAYLSDWWINYAATGGHQQDAIARGGLYVASLNHAIWLHRPLRADDWLHFDSTSHAAAHGRGLSVARVHDRQGRLVASATQECLMAPRAGGG